MAAPSEEAPPQPRRPFGRRLLTDPARLFQHNAWDNVEWSEEQEASAKRKVQENSSQLLPQDKQGSNKVVSVPVSAALTNSTVLLKPEVRKNDFILMGAFIVREAEKDFQIYFLKLGLKDIDTSKMKAYLNGNGARGALWSSYVVETVPELVSTTSSHLSEEYEVNAKRYWDDFYKIHENGFFKDRHWLFTEFPELAPNRNPGHQEDSVCEHTHKESHNEGLGSCENGHCSLETRAENQLNLIKSTPTLCTEELAPQKSGEVNQSHGDYPGSSASYRILEVGCGAGNTVFPILQTNNDPGLFVYCCDFSTTAVDLVQNNAEYDSSRCFAFVHDLCNDQSPFPMPDESLDVVILIFVLSAILPEKMQCIVNRLSRLLKPGGMILLRDYGRYDLAQLRFKKGQCLSDNFYVRGDGTRVYFFTQDELDDLFTRAGLEKIQNLVDRRLQVNRGKQMTMYRVWIQCKYQKPAALQP